MQGVMYISPGLLAAPTVAKPLVMAVEVLELKDWVEMLAALAQLGIAGAVGYIGFNQYHIERNQHLLHIGEKYGDNGLLYARAVATITAALRVGDIPKAKLGHNDLVAALMHAGCYISDPAIIEHLADKIKASSALVNRLIEETEHSAREELSRAAFMLTNSSEIDEFGQVNADIYRRYSLPQPVPPSPMTALKEWWKDFGRAP